MNFKRINIWMLTLLGVLAVVGSVQANRQIDADLSISIDRNAEILSAASNLEISLTVENLGPDSAEAVVLNFSLDSTHGKEAFSVLSVEAEGWSCSSDVLDESIDYTCERGMLEASTESSVLVSVIQGEVGDPASFSLQASVSSEIEDLDESNNFGYFVVPIAISVSDLAVAMSSDLQIANPGEPVSFGIITQNLGPDIAENVDLLFNLPEGMSVSQTHGDGWMCFAPENQDEGTLCQLNSLEPDETRELILDTIAPGSGSPLLPSVFLSSDTYDPIPENNSAFYDLALAEERADLSLTIETEAEFAEPGGVINASITIENQAGIDARDLVLTLTRLDRTDLEFVDHVGWSCGPSEENLTQLCTRDSLATDSSSEINLQILVSNNFEQETLSVLASVSSALFDENTANDLAELTLATFIDRADLSITGSIEGDVVFVGSTSNYALEIENLGPSDASDVSVVISLPPNTTFIDVGDGQWDCSATAHEDLLETTCQTARIDSGLIEALNLSYRLDEQVGLDDLTALFSISSSLPDPNYEDNSLRIQSRIVNGQADIAVSVERGSDIAVLGSLVPFAIRTENAGPDSANDVVVRAIPPSGVRVDSLSGEGWACELVESADLSTGQCQQDDLQPGASSSIDVILVAEEDFILNNLELTAYVQSNRFDPNPLNNASTDDVRYYASSADLSIGQSVAVDLVGATARYSITVRNEGASDAVNIRVTNLLPFSAEWIGFDDDLWLCEPDSTEGLAAICSLDSLAVGSTSILEYEINITELIGAPEMINFLTVSGDQFDPVLSNNSLLAAVALE